VLEDEQPSRAEMLRTLAEVKNAAEVLMNALGRPVVLEILGTIRPVHIPKVLYLLMMLRDLHEQASFRGSRRSAARQRRWLGCME
jgi:hypothetical protein